MDSSNSTKLITTLSGELHGSDYIGKPILDGEGNKIGEVVGYEAMVASSNYGNGYVTLTAKFNEGFTMRKSLDVGVSIGYADQLRKDI